MTDEKLWGGVGYDTLDEADKVYDERFTNSDELERFYLKVGSDNAKEVVFETDEPFTLWEHRLNIGGSWKNWLTCRSKIDSAGECRACKEGDASFVGVYFVRDMTGWKSKKDGKQKGVGKRMLYVATRKVMRQIKILKDRRGSLVGWKVAISRAENTSSGCGDLFDPIEKIDMSALLDVGPVPSMDDLWELFRPLSNAEMEAVLAGKKLKGSDPADDTVEY